MKVKSKRVRKRIQKAKPVKVFSTSNLTGIIKGCKSVPKEKP